MFKSTKDLVKDAFEALKDKFAYANKMQAPKIEKVVVSVGTGSFKDPAKIKIVPDRLAKITGQKPKYNKAKKSIAGFKLREGQTIGYQVTLRGDRMYSFLDKLIHVALPRTRDFRGLKPSSVDDMGNFSFGIREHTIFPETSDEELRNVFSLGITIVTNKKDKKEVLEFLKSAGLPIRDENNS